MINTLDGELNSLSERFLGAELFGRRIDYDTKSDSIVRVRANDVRRRLTEYYADQRSSPAVVINLCSGSYIPEFHWPQQEDSQQNEASSLASGSSSSLTNAPNGSALHLSNDRDVDPPASGVQEPSEGYSRGGDNSVPGFINEAASSALVKSAHVGISRRAVAAGSIVAGLLILAFAVSCFTLWQELRVTRQSLYPWRNSPAVAGLWGTFLGDQRDTDLVLTDSSFSLVEALTNKSFNLNDYLGHSYMGHFQDHDPEMAAALSRISNWGLGSSGEFEVAQRMLALDPTRQKLHFFLARKYQPDLIRRDNVILMGSPYGNPWSELFESRMNFTFDPKDPARILNRSPKAGESATYAFDVSGSFGFCIIAYLPTPDHSGSALLIQGTSGEPTEAGVDFLLSEAKLAAFQQSLGVSKLPYFELLLKTSWIKGTPIASNIVAYRTYPEKQ
ncbi:hypothetical protein [Bryocella elongata]|uniref:hypothetical protein n=1 Tax=Bryocella elongata TaxID=863522 RepID=UPI0011AFFC50|nr:hypothetical protein [Bryocella elongata]